MYIGPQAAVFAELFPAAFRYSGTSLSITLGTLLGGAITPRKHEIVNEDQSKDFVDHIERDLEHR